VCPPINSLRMAWLPKNPVPPVTNTVLMTRHPLNVSQMGYEYAPVNSNRHRERQ
jgi:hypothetical protein